MKRIISSKEITMSILVCEQDTYRPVPAPLFTNIGFRLSTKTDRCEQMDSTTPFHFHQTLCKRTS